MAAYDLHRILIAPLQPALGQTTRCYVTAEGPLADLPLDLLVTAPPPPGASGLDTAALKNAAWLGDRYAIVRLLTVAALKVSGDAPVRTRTAFVGYGAPALAPD